MMIQFCVRCRETCRLQNICGDSVTCAINGVNAVNGVDGACVESFDGLMLLVLTVSMSWGLRANAMVLLRMLSMVLTLVNGVDWGLLF
jgi:hypothetical protein